MGGGARMTSYMVRIDEEQRQFLLLGVESAILRGRLPPTRLQTMLIQLPRTEARHPGALHCFDQPVDTRTPEQKLKDEGTLR